MRFSTIRTGIVASAAAIALAACSGHGLIPSQSTAPNALQPLAATSPCKIPGIWYFHGYCTTAALTGKGGKTTLKAYSTIQSAVLKLGKNSLKSKTTFVIGDATGKKDVTGKLAGHRWAPYSQKTCSSKNACPGKPAAYIMAFNTGSTTVTFSGSSTLTVAEKSFPGKTCGPALLQPTLKWASYIGILKATPANGKVTLTIPGGVPQFSLPKGPAYVALVCM